MPTLPLFAAGSFRQWMAGNNPQSTQPTRCREDGLRGSDESVTLRDNDRILQHIVESSRCPNDHHVGTDGRRMTSHGSTVAASIAEGPPKPAELDALEAEIETIKADIQILRVGAESMHQTDLPHTSDRQSDFTVRVEGSKIPTPINRQLAGKTSESKRGEVKAPCSKIQLRTASSSNILNTHLTPSLHSTQPKPHFAQPTQAATRRVHQTLRKDTSSVKSSPEPSPGRSTKAKAPDFATDKRAAQRNLKRTSLPQSWAMSAPPKSESDVLKHHHGDADLHAGSEHAVIQPNTNNSDTPRTNSQPIEQVPQSSNTTISRRDTVSYMSPTASTQRRSRAAIDSIRAHNAPRSERAEAEIMVPFTISPASSDAIRWTGSLSPLRDGTIAPSTTPVDVIPTMRFPMPLPHVANTVVTSQAPNHDMLGNIRQQLGVSNVLCIAKQLKRRDQWHNVNNPHGVGSHNSILSPVLEYMNKPMHGTNADGTIDHDVMVREADSASAMDPVRGGLPTYAFYDDMRHSCEARAARDPTNEPISRLVTGLRGQSSANIGRALGSDQPAVRVASDPAIMYEGPKPSSVVVFAPSTNPAIVYQRRKVSTESGPQSDPTLMLNNKKVPQSGSLRPTAMTFVPTTVPTHLNMSPPRGPSPSQEEYYRFNRVDTAGYLQDYPDHEPSYLRYGPDFISGETPIISPVSDASSEGMRFTTQPQSVVPFEDEFFRATPIVSPFPNNTFAEQLSHEIQANINSGFGADIVAPWANTTGVLYPAFVQQAYGPPPGFNTASQTPTLTSMPSASVTAFSLAENLRTTPPWQIRGEGRRSYQWEGGDGREISFRGIGPDAEHDPNRPVEYRDLRANTSTIHTPRHYGTTVTTPPTAPRSMREQAKRMSGSQIPRSEDQQEGK